MKIGIVGLPNVGKSTLFNAITNAGIESANYPFCTIEPNIGIVAVPDYRIDELVKMYNPVKTTYAVIEFVDIAGLVKGASKGEGLGNKFLAHIREVDAVVHVVRCFEDDNIIHVDGKVSPLNDIDTINTELIFADLEHMERRVDRLSKSVKADKKNTAEYELSLKIKENLEKGIMARSMDYTEAEKEMLALFPLLSLKPVIYAANLSEDDFINSIANNENLKAVTKLAQAENSQVIAVCAKIEEEISSLDKEEKLMFLNDLGLEKSGLDSLIEKSYALLNLISFLTAGTPEVRAWTIIKGTKAPGAAGKIHTDFEKGFIRAEVVAFPDLIEQGSLQAAKEKGLVRSEGKEYTVKDGDVVLFRFNV